MRLGPFFLGQRGNQGIYIGDAMQLGKWVPDNSVSLIICDPIYWRMDQYAWLDRFGKRVLIKGGNLIAQCGHIFALRAARQFRRLSFAWLLMEHTGGGAKIGSRKVVATEKPYLWFCNGFPRNGKWVLDWLKTPGKRKGVHEWEDNPIMFRQLIARLAGDGPVVDPFAGSGTVSAVCKELQIPCLAFEIDASTARMARERVSRTQPSLFGLNQLGMEFTETT